MITPAEERLTSLDVDFNVIKLSSPVHTVKDVQEACNCSASEVIKTLVFIGESPIMVILPGDKKVDTEKIRAISGSTGLRMATKEEVFRLTGYQVGTIGPFGVTTSIRQIADDSLTELKSLIFGSGQENTLIRLSRDAFYKAFSGTTSQISTPSMEISDATTFLGKAVTVRIDRPLGSKHPKHAFTYEVNYGYVPDTLSPDGEELDAYVLGIEESLETFTGICIAVIHRTNDADDKLIVVPEEMQEISDAEIRKLTHFQEQFFESMIVRVF